MIKKYEQSLEEEWDNFVLNNSYNGNFLQTRRFLNYHPKEKYIDHSLVFRKGETIAAVLPANENEEGKVLISHEGSTFGGLIIGKEFCSTTDYNWIFEEMTNYFKEKKFRRVELRMPHWLYCNDNRRNELLDYYFQLFGFVPRKEVGFFVDLNLINDDYESKFDSLKRRKLKKAYKNNLLFKELGTEEEITEFYEVLYDNMKKFNTTPLHSLEELLDFKYNRLSKETSFYGIYIDGKMIAGSMVFDFCNRRVFHTQYLASRHDYLEFCPNEFMYTKLIWTAKNSGYKYLSYGTATLEHGNVYNESLGIYKEGFNTDTYVNTTYILNIS